MAGMDKICESKASFKNVSIKQISDSISILTGEIGKASMIDYQGYTLNDYIDAAAPQTNNPRDQQLREEAREITNLRYGGRLRCLIAGNGITINGVSSVQHLAGDIYACSQKGGYGIYNLSTGEYLTKVYSSVLSQPMPTDSTLLLLPMDGGNKMLCISNTGKIYRATQSVNDGIVITDGKGKYGLVDETRKIAIPVEYDEIVQDNQNSRIENGSICNHYNYYLMKDSLWGILAPVNNSLKMIAECIYPYNVKDGEKYIPFKYLRYYEKQKQRRDACFVVMSNGKAGILDNFGKVLVPCQYDSGSFSENPPLGYLYDNGRTITYNPLDKGTTTRKYSNYKRFIGAKSYYCVEQNGKFGVVDDKDNLILPIKYSQITEAITSDNGHLDDGFHVWDANGRIGVVKVINGKGKEIVPCAGNYDRIWGYESYGVIVVKNGKQGCIKENGATFCRPVYDGHINGLKRIGFVKNSATSNDVTVDIYDYNGKYLTSVNVGNDYLDQRWFVQKYLM